MSYCRWYESVSYVQIRGLSIAMLCLIGAFAHAATETVDGIEWTYTVSGSSASVGYMNGDGGGCAIPFTTTGAIAIPSSLGEYPITRIESFAFAYCSGLTSVTIPDGVTSIGAYAFLDCDSLTNVIIPDSVTDINLLAFEGTPFYSNRPDGLVVFGKTAFGVKGECPSVVAIPDGVTSINGGAFEGCRRLTSVTIPSSVKSIGSFAFAYCSGLLYVMIPESVTSIGKNAFANTLLIFNYMPPSIDSTVLESCYFFYPEEYEAVWKNLLVENGKVLRVAMRSEMRETDLAVMDVHYVACKNSGKGAGVSVRALAFEDGERSFAKVVRPETFVNDANGNPTAQNVGDNVAANVEHKLSWKVSSDWATRLAKVKFEVLACDGALLPMETTIIPVSDRYGKMRIVWNRHTNDQIFDALMWLYADKAAGLTLENGALKAGGKTLSNGTEIVDGKAAAEFVYRAMGFDGVLSDDLLNYVNEETRLGLSPDGIRQYAYKMMGE